jgi:hypothetical protein
MRYLYELYIRTHNKDKIKDEIGSACNMYWRDKKYRLYKVLVGKSEGNRPLGKPRFKWEIIYIEVVLGGGGGVVLTGYL